MDIRRFRSELAAAFEAAGFDRKKVKGSAATVWVLPGREVDREFWEHAIRRPWGFLLSGSLAFDVPAFRAWLSAKFPKDRHGILWSCLLSRHIANERDMLFGVEDGQPPYADWVANIRERLSELPDTIVGLLAAKQSHAPWLARYWDRFEAPARWRYFEAWATGDEPDHPPPYRLPTGQIVDPPANDTGT